MKPIFLFLYSFFLIYNFNLLPSLAQSDHRKTSIIYRCKGGKTFQAEFLGNKVNLQLKRGKILNLPAVITGSGAKYSDGKITLFTKGEEAFIEFKQKITHDGCSSKTPMSSQETYYNCDSQIAPFPRKESVNLAQAEKLVTERDGDLFIYRCFPR